MKKLLLAFCMLALVITSCQQDKYNFEREEGVTYAAVETEYGDIIVKLYNETPQHRDNFIKLTKEEFYKDLLFHRVMKEFMVQGGDPNSRGADAKVQLGNGGPGYTIPAEIIDTFYHVKGALAAARQPDNVNPEKASSGSQFYLVHGKVTSAMELSQIEQQRNSMGENNMLRTFIQAPENASLLQKIQEFQANQLSDSINVLIERIKPIALQGFQPFAFSAKQKEIYSTVGGAPFLDGDYTVFGEIVDGLALVDSIAAQPVATANRPAKDIKMNVRILD